MEILSIMISSSLGKNKEIETLEIPLIIPLVARYHQNIVHACMKILIVVVHANKDKIIYINCNGCSQLYNCAILFKQIMI